MSEILPSDQYYIRNAETFAGRNHVEDRSANPKPVNCPTDGDPELWDLVLLPSGRYIISARGAPTGEINNRLYALIQEGEGKAEEWIITKRQEDDKNRSQYTIEKADGGEGWVKQISEPQISIHHIAATMSIPPQIAGIGLWNIQPLVN